MRSWILLLVLCITAIATRAKPDSPKVQFSVDKYQLENGLTVLLHQDSSVPTISYHTWFRVGSRDEEPGYTGIAHLFEHMMFKGAKRYTGKQYDRLLQANGANNNAFTSYDYTGYYVNLPSNKLELVMDIESDRFENLQITEAHLKSEREVVKEERRVRVDNSIYGKMNEVLFSTAFKVHPYRWPVIGWMRDLNRIDLKKSVEFYKKFYSPNNAVLVIAGDIDVEKTKKMIEKFYAHMPRAKNLLPRTYSKEPAQKGYRFQKIIQPAQSASFAIGYKSVAAGNKEAYALDLLSSILGEGESSRLNQKIVYKKPLATSVGVYNYTPASPGIFRIFVSLKPGVSFEKARKAVMGEIYRVRNNKVTERELQKAKNQVMRGYVDSIKTISGKANILALNEIIFSDYKVFFDDLSHYQNVSREDILAVAKKYLQLNQANVVLLEPKK